MFFFFFAQFFVRIRVASWEVRKYFLRNSDLTLENILLYFRPFNIVFKVNQKFQVSVHYPDQREVWIGESFLKIFSE